MWINWGDFDPHFSQIRNKYGGGRFSLGQNLSICPLTTLISGINPLYYIANKEMMPVKRLHRIKRLTYGIAAGN